MRPGRSGRLVVQVPTHARARGEGRLVHLLTLNSVAQWVQQVDDLQLEHQLIHVYNHINSNVMVLKHQQIKISAICFQKVANFFPIGLWLVHFFKVTKEGREAQVLQRTPRNAQTSRTWPKFWGVVGETFWTETFCVPKSNQRVTLMYPNLFQIIKLNMCPPTSQNLSSGVFTKHFSRPKWDLTKRQVNEMLTRFCAIAALGPVPRHKLPKLSMASTPNGTALLFFLVNLWFCNIFGLVWFWFTKYLITIFFWKWKNCWVCVLLTWLSLLHLTLPKGNTSETPQYSYLCFQDAFGSSYLLSKPGRMPSWSSAAWPVMV